MKIAAPHRYLQVTICFCVFFSLFYAAMSGAVADINHEVGDFAANSLLIQKVKAGWMLQGNYSRVGFNHPGPAILLVLAAGEVFLFDMLHVVASPFSGQLVAVAAYNAFWISIAFLIFLGVLRNFVAATATLAVLAAMLAVADYQIFIGIWFPHLYVMPFCVLVLALATLIEGDLRFFPVFSLATGFLVNGHVSFIPFIALMVMLGLAVNILRYGFGERSLASQLFMRKNLVNVAISMLIVLVFFLPLIVLTITNFPGPVAEYIQFGGGRPANSAISAINYVAVYWGGLLAFSLAIAALICADRNLRSKEIGTGVDGIPVALIIATVCLFLYAKFGIDMLSEVYIGEYYYSIPAILISYFVMKLLILDREYIKIAVCASISVFAFFVVSTQIHKPTNYQVLYNDGRGFDLYTGLKEIKRQGRIALDFPIDANWGDVWSTFLGAQITASRRHEDLFCINKGWHISFTKEAKCSDAELKESDRYIARKSNVTAATTNSEELIIGQFRLYKIGQFEFDKDITVNVRSSPHVLEANLLKSGWSSVETDFVWSIDNEATLSFSSKNKFSGKIILDLEAFLPVAGLSQSVQISDGVSPTKSVLFTQDTKRQKIAYDVGERSAGEIDITISIQNPRSPKELGLSADERKLGVALYGVEVRSAK